MGQQPSLSRHGSFQKPSTSKTSTPTNSETSSSNKARTTPTAAAAGTATPPPPPPSGDPPIPTFVKKGGGTPRPLPPGPPPTAAQEDDGGGQPAAPAVVPGKSIGKQSALAVPPPPRRESQRVREAWYNIKYIESNNIGHPMEMRCPRCRCLVERPGERDARFTVPCRICTSRWPIVVAKMIPELPGRDQWVRAVQPQRPVLTWVRMLRGSEESRLLTSLEAFTLETDDALLERLKKLNSTPTAEATHEELTLQATVANAWQTRELEHIGFVRFFPKDNGPVSWMIASAYALDPKAIFPELGLEPKEICWIRSRPLSERLNWFREQVAKIRAEDKTMHGASNIISVRRDCILEDASTCFMTIPNPKELWKPCRYVFQDEPAMDSGGVAREFYSMVGAQIFDPLLGLFEPVRGSEGLLSYRINLNSGLANDNHTQYYRFLGRLLAKALIDGYTVPCHMSRDLYKHLLAEPIGISDVALVDAQLGKSMIDVLESDDLDSLCLDFTTGVWNMGVTNVVELVENGATIPVNAFNVDKYLNLMLRHAMLDRHVVQLSFFLRGFDEVVPTALVSVFSAREFEDVIAGMETIDVDDWVANTEYRGGYAKHGENHEVIDWFWSFIRSLDHDKRSKFLQFVTGSARVPVQGFKSLQGDDGRNMQFSIDSIPLSTSVFPRAHTCFNRLELPMYKTEEDLKKFCHDVVESQVTGFSMN